MSRKDQSDISHIEYDTRDFFYPFPFYTVSEDFDEGGENTRFLVHNQRRKNLYRRILRNIFKRQSGPYESFFHIDMPNHTLPPKWRNVFAPLMERGYFRQYHLKPMYHDLPKLFLVSLEWNLENMKSDGSVPKHNILGHAARLDFEDALSRALGEFAERLPFLLYRDSDFKKASAESLEKQGIAHLSPLKMTAYSDKQRTRDTLLDIQNSDEFLWTWGKSISGNRKMLVPAQLAYWTYHTYHRSWQEKRIGESNTNGMASGRTYAEASVSGIYELVQRDGFLIFWLNRIAPPSIDVSSGITHPELKHLLARCTRYHIEVHFLNTTTELGISSCACVLVDSSGLGPKVSIGAGSGPKWEDVLYSALCEALATQIWMREYKDRGGSYDELHDPRADTKRTRSFDLDARVRLWANPDMFRHFSFFLGGSRTALSSLEDLFEDEKKDEEEFLLLVEMLRKQGEDYLPIVCEGKHEALRMLGAHSVKVIIPALVPMYLHERYAGWGKERIREVPEKLGYKPADALNPFPHPFP